jgi:hypothetical protein
MGLEGKTLLLGIGAQKTGTSWLARYFLEHPQVFASPMKALHFFDALHAPEPGERTYFRRRAVRNLAEEAARVADEACMDAPGGEAFARLRALIDGARQLYDPSAYLGYFAREVVGERVFADMSPSYQMLPAELFGQMHRWHERVKFLFVMRDPVRRHLSHCRYDARLRGEHLGPDGVLANLDDRAYIARGDYPRTLEALDAAGIPEEDRLELFFEELFTSEAIGRLCAFLGVDLCPARTDVPVNATAVEEEFDQSVLQQCRERFSVVYEYVHARYGAEVPASWGETAQCCI